MTTILLYGIIEMYYNFRLQIARSGLTLCLKLHVEITYFMFHKAVMSSGNAKSGKRI